MLLLSDFKVQGDVFAKWDYFLPRGVLDPVTNVMKSVSLSHSSQKTRCSVPLSYLPILGEKGGGGGCF